MQMMLIFQGEVNSDLASKNRTQKKPNAFFFNYLNTSMKFLMFQSSVKIITFFCEYLKK